MLQPPLKRLKRQTAQVPPPARAHRDGLVSYLSISYHQQVGDALQSVLADFKADLLVSQVRVNPKALVSERRFHLPRVACLVVSDVQHHRLHWRQPWRQRAAVMLDQNSNEPLHGAKDGPV